MRLSTLERLCERTDLVGCRILVTELMAVTRAEVAAVTMQNGDELHIETTDAMRRIRPGGWEPSPGYSFMANAGYCSLSETDGVITLQIFDVEAKIYTTASQLLVDD